MLNYGMKMRYKRLLGRLGKGSLELLAMTVATLDLAARPGAYVFGRSQFASARRLEAKGWLEIDKGDGQWAARLTELGRSALNDGIDPEAYWSENWDGKWQILMFDLPVSCRKERERLHAWLKDRRWGCLQGSVWISHRSLVEGDLDCDELDVHSDQLFLVEASSRVGFTPQQVVGKAWDFETINHAYRVYMNALLELKKRGRGPHFSDIVQGWANAAKRDPFLPSVLEPHNYLGKKAWRLRNKMLMQA